MMPQKSISANPIGIPNARLVLYAPFLPRLFQLLDYTENQRFRGEAERLRAISALQYAVYGDRKEAFSEDGLFLNKLLTGYDSEQPVSGLLELSDTEIETVGQMMTAAKNNWDKLRNTSTEGFRVSFLQRPGQLELKYDHYELRVAEKPYDILLDTLPWSFGKIKYSWMEKPIVTTWRNT